MAWVRSQHGKRLNPSGMDRGRLRSVFCLLLAGTAALLIATAPAPAQPPAGDSRSSLYLATDTMDHSRLRDRGQAEETTRQTPLQLHEWAMIIAGLTLITLLLHSRHRKIMNDCENIF